jgi:hypothetical protein
MNTQRIEMLKNAVLQEPNDPFYPYALALEHMHTQRPVALTMFHSLLVAHPDYLPTYYQAALLSIETGEDAQGVAIIEKGIALARKQNDQKALNELRSLLDNLY